MSHLEDFIAGWVGGVAGLIMGHPLDTIKVRQQAMGQDFFKTAKTTFHHEGFRGFYKGLFAPFVTIGPTNAVFFHAYAIGLSLLNEKPTTQRVDINDPTWWQNVVIASFFAGFVQALVTCPVELVKIVLQTRTANKGKWKSHYIAPYNSAPQAAAGIYRKKGIRGLYRGFAPMFFRDVPTSCLWMYTYEILLPRGAVQPRWQVLTAGGVAGVASWIFVIPFDVVKTRMQSDSQTNPIYKGMIDCFYKSYKSEGRGIFMQGGWLSLIRAFSINAVAFYVYETSLGMLKRFT